MALRGINTFEIDNSVRTVLLFSMKGSTLKGKNLLPMGAKSRQILVFYSKPLSRQERKQEVTKAVTF